MTFIIKVIAEPATLQEHISPVWGEITMGDFIESFPLITSLWSATDYERQWVTAISALVTGGVDRAMLVVDIQPKQVSDGIVCFVLFREDTNVFIQHRFMCPAPRLDVRSPEAIAPLITPRFDDPEEEGKVSEWRVTLDDLRRFCEEATSRQGPKIRHL